MNLLLLSLLLFLFIGAVADLEGVPVVCLNPPLGPHYFNSMEKLMKLMKSQIKCNESPLGGFEPPF